jgi:CRP-like cAMP-binding protein
MQDVRDVMLRFTQAYIAQLSQNVACNRLHSTEQQLARWMLECADRLKTDDINMTNEFIAEMLGGLRRAGISETAATLQQRRLIVFSQGALRVSDSDGLKAASCECFQLILDEHDRLLGPAIERHGGSVSMP